jgi:hypothetical protein
VATPTLAVFGATAEQAQAVWQAVAQINEALAWTPIRHVVWLPPNSPEAAIKVYFAPARDLPALARQHHFPYVSRNAGFFWTFWNREHEIYGAVVLLASDRLAGPELRHFALEEVAQALGPSNDSPRFADSIFYAKRADGGRATELSDLDKKLLVFLYNHVPPGAGRAEVRAALQRYWAWP